MSGVEVFLEHDTSLKLSEEQIQQVVSVTLGLLIVSMSFDFCEPEVAHTYYKVVCVGSPVSPVFPCNSLRVRA